MQKQPSSLRWLLSASAVALAIPAFSSVASAQGNQTTAEAIEEIITTGTRRAERSAADSAVPIDVVTGQEFVNMGTSDLDDMLRNTVPSYNVQRHAIDDAATLVRPATLRGLPPDNTLVLVNGKRRHRSGVIAELGGSLAAGSQGADISAIPALAIKQTEILRDGAAAQYGSDAIAGVMNFVLRDDREGMTAEIRTGEFFEGDGSMVQFAANAGFALGDDGFANVTFQWHEQDPTSRSTQRTDAMNLIAAGNTAVRQPYAQIWGAPEYRDNWNLFINSGIELGASQELYAFGNVGRRETEGGFFFRNPNSRSGVYTAGDIRAVVDTNINRGDTGITSNCPALTSPGSGSSGPLDPVAVAADAAALAALPSNCWVLNQVIPGGYTPQFGGQLKDASIVGGLRGEFENGLLYDFSASFGRNAVAFFLNNTWNPSLGPDGIIQGQLQRDFRIGEYIQSETNLNADFVLPIPVDGFASDLNFAFGFERRDEVFTVRIGEENSWRAGRFAFQSGNGTNFYSDGSTPLPDLSIGAHGFAGFSPNQAGEFGRSNIAVYTELEADIVENFTAAIALRYEDFEDFGDTTNFKVAARWGISDSFSVRGSASTGFRAPTPGQSNVTKVSTTTIDGELQQRGQIPPTNPIAQFLGGQQLQPEDATNFTLGTVFDVTDNLSVTLDYFNINVKDRISQTGSIVISGRPVPPGVNCPNAAANPNGNLALCLQELGIPGAADLNSVSFYTNDFETTTQGVDIVATYNLDWGDMGDGSLTAAWNWTETEVDAAGEEISRNRIAELENFNPKTRGIFTYTHFKDNWRFLARASWYGEWVNGDYSGDPTFVSSSDPNWSRDNPQYTIDCALFNDKCYDGEWLVDLEAAYTFNDNYSLTVGAQNITDNFGPVDQNNLRINGAGQNIIGSGNTYDQSTPFGQDGGFWYVRFTAEFE